MSSRSSRPWRRKSLSAFIQLALAAGCVTSPAFATTRVVENLEDAGTGSLRDAVNNAATGDDITFDCAALGCPATIVLTSQGNQQGFPGPTALSIKGKTLTIEAPNPGDITLDIQASGVTSATSLRAVFVDSTATVTLRNLVLTNGTATGGKGGVGGGGSGGGAAGLGGAIFSQGSLTLDGVSFGGNHAIGGNGGPSLSLSGGFSTGSGGGGGMGGDGGSQGGSSPKYYGGGGGGTGGNGGSGSGGNPVGSGGGGGPGYQGMHGGSGGNLENTPGAGSLGGGGGGGGTGSAGGTGSYGGGGGGSSGAGGFGGGGGGQGAGGFGGGGGGGGFIGAAGAGGPGGASGLAMDYLSGSTLLEGAGGGGGGLGGGAFIRSGSLTVKNSGNFGGIAGNVVTPGVGAPLSAPQHNGAAVGGGIFLMTGTTTTFDIDGTYTIVDDIADDSATSLPPNQTYGAGSAAGAGIQKSGAGTLVLAGNNTYAGITEVVQGTLEVDGIVGDLELFSGVLSGTGSAGNIDLTSADISPGVGSTAGTLTAESLTWHAGGGLTMRLGTGPVDSDLLVLNGPLSRGDGSGYQVHFTQGSALPVAGTTYNLITAASTDLTAADIANITYDALPPMRTINGTFSLDGATLQFTVNSVTSDIIFKNGFE